MEVQDISQKLAYRGYPHELIVKSFLKANQQNREDLLAMKKENSTMDKNIRLITTHNTHNPPMKDILQKYKDYFIQNQKGIKFQDIQTVYRQAANLRDKLVKRTYREATLTRDDHPMQQNMYYLPKNGS